MMRVMRKPDLRLPKRAYELCDIDASFARLGL